MRNLILASALSVLGACKSDHEVIRRQQSDVFYQEPTNEVDILWVIDNSQSMADEQYKVASEFDSFISSIEETGLEFHIGVMTTDMDNLDQRGQLVHGEGEPVYLAPDTPDYEALFAQRVQVGIDGSDREKGIDAAYQALSEPLVSSVNDGFLRSGATLSIIYVSDENDCTDHGALDGYHEQLACYDHSDELVPLRELIDDYRNLRRDREAQARMLVSAVVGPEIIDNCDGAVPGFRYDTMADAFGGLIGSICEEDFSGIMNNLGLEASGLMTSFQLTYPAVEDTLEVYVEDVAVDPGEVDGWTYAPEYYILYFHGSAVPPRGSEITVHYEIASAY